MTNIITTNQAVEIVEKANNIFGKKWIKQLALTLDIPQPYVSYVKKIANGGTANVPKKSVPKFIEFLNSDEKITTTDTTTNEVVELSDEEVLESIKMRFDIAKLSVSSIFRGNQSGVIVSGPAGCGKSYNIEKRIEEEVAQKDGDFKYTHLKGANISFTGLYKLIFQFREGGVIVFDDSDGIWGDEKMMNLMKAVMDTSKVRTVSCASGGKWVEELANSEGVDEEDVRQFTFKGKVIFITNKDINGIIKDRKRGFEHYLAIMDRSFYIDLEMFSMRAKFLWCEYVFTNFIAESMNLSQEKADEIMEFVRDNQARLRDISVRGIEMIADVACDPIFSENDFWKKQIEVTRFTR